MRRARPTGKGVGQAVASGAVGAAAVVLGLDDSPGGGPGRVGFNMSGRLPEFLVSRPLPRPIAGRPLHGGWASQAGGFLVAAWNVNEATGLMRPKLDHVRVVLTDRRLTFHLDSYRMEREPPSRAFAEYPRGGAVPVPHLRRGGRKLDLGFGDGSWLSLSGWNARDNEVLAALLTEV